MSSRMAQWKKTYKSFQADFHRFANQSTMKAFTFISNSEYVTESILWLLVIVIFICVTIWNVSVTVKSYEAGGTVSKISSATDRSIQFPNPSLCFAYTTQMALSRMLKTQQFKLTDSANILEWKNYFPFKTAPLRNVLSAVGEIFSSPNRHQTWQNCSGLVGLFLVSSMKLRSIRKFLLTIYLR